MLIETIQELRIPIPDPLTGSDDEPVDSRITPWLRRGFQVICTDPVRGLYFARKKTCESSPRNGFLRDAAAGAC